ncbi:MAG: hypothetical protein ACSHX9_07760 [Luteolibacter sp.]
MYPPNRAPRAAQSSNIFRGISTAIIALAAGCLSANAQISFGDGADFSGYQHGSIIDPTEILSNSAYLATTLSVTPPPGGYDKAVIFATQDPNVPGNPDVEDQDLIPNGTGNLTAADVGNIAIIQENTDFTITNGVIDNPYVEVDDHANGGTFTFDLNPGNDVTVNAFRIDLIDVESANQIKIIAYDGNGSFTWTGSDLQSLGSGIEYGNASANRTSVLTAAEANLSGITKVDIVSTTSFAIGNFKVRGTVVPEVSSSLLAILSAGIFCFRRKRSN